MSTDSTIIKRGWVWFSTDNSRAEGKLSLLALLETTICVGLYWWIWIVEGFHLELGLLLVSTLLVLFRSKDSIEKGIALWESFRERKPLYGRCSLAIFAITFSPAFCLLLWFQPLGNRLEWSLEILWATSAATWMGVVALAAYGVDAKHLTRLDYWSLFLFGGITAYSFFGLPLGVIAAFIAAFAGALIYLTYALALRALSFRTISVLKNFRSGLKLLPENWREQVLLTDSMILPDLLPGVPRKEIFKREFELSKQDQRRTQKFLHSEELVKASGAYWLTAFFWRLLIKSTAWFYIPFLWVQFGWSNAQGKDLRHWVEDYANSKWSQHNFLLSSVLLLFSIVSLIDPISYISLSVELKVAEAPMTALGWLLVLDFEDFGHQPWQWFYVPSWIITIILYYRLDYFALALRRLNDQGSLDSSLRRWMWVHNLRFTLTFLGLSIALYHFLAAVNVFDWV